MAHIYVATPMYGGMCTGVYMQSILGLVSLFSANGHKVSCASMFNESLITRGRNNMTHGFLKTDADYLFWIDADIKFDPHDAYRMYLANVDIIGGVYPKKEINWQTVREAALRGEANLENFTGSFVVNLIDYKPEITVPEHLPCEVSAVGTGFMLVKRHVIEKMKSWTPRFRNDMSAMQAGEEIYSFFMDPICPDTGRFLSEDYFFCEQWRKHGGKIYAAPWCKLGHMGTYLFEGTLITTTGPEDEPRTVRTNKRARVDGGSTRNAVGSRSKSTRNANSGQVRKSSSKTAKPKTGKPGANSKRSNKAGK